MNDVADKDKLVDLVNKIMDSSVDDIKRTQLLTKLSVLVPHPTVADLIFWPQLHGLGINPSPEEIVDLAMQYKSIKL